MSHPNADTYRRLYQAFLAGDRDTVKGMIAPDVVWHEAGNPEAVRGREAVLQRMPDAGSVGSVDLHAVLADDAHTVALITASLRKPNGDAVTYPVVEVAHLEDGMVTERWAFMDAVPADVAAFFAGG